MGASVIALLEPVIDDRLSLLGYREPLIVFYVCIYATVAIYAHCNGLYLFTPRSSHATSGSKRG